MLLRFFTDSLEAKMNQDNSIGFFRQYFVACFQPSKYGELLKKNVKSQIGYLCLLIIFLIFVEAVIPFTAWDISVGGLENLFLNRIPEFTVENGTMTMENPVAFEINPAMRVKADPGVEKYENADFEDKYHEEILISKTNILVRAGERITNIPLDYFKGSVMNNQSLVELLPAIYFTLVMYFIMAVMIKAVEYLFITAFFAMFCRAGVRTPEGKCVSFKEAFIIAFYARTLFSIVGSVNACMGYVLSSFLELFLSVIVTVALIYRAEMSVLKPELL